MSSGEVTLNEFQQLVEEWVCAVLRELRITGITRRVAKEQVPFLSGGPEAVIYLTAQALDVGIRQDSASFTILGKGFSYEMVDYPSPEALVEALVSVLKERWLSSQHE